MKIKAKGMFKRLGYIKEPIQNERFISYRKPNGISFSYIQFDLKYKTYNAYYFGSKGEYCTWFLSIKEMLAIQKQREELWWI